MFVKLVPLFILVFIIASCSGKKSADASKKDKPPVVVDVLVVQSADFQTDIEVNGNVSSDDMVELHTEANGRLTYLNIPDGAFVSAGTILARVNDADLQAQMQQQKVQLDLAEKTERRLAKLIAVNGVEQATYDAAVSEVELKKANIEVLKAQIDKTVLKAPFSGKLGLRQVSLGAYINSSTPICTLQRTDRIRIDFAIPDAYSGLVRQGMSVGVKTGADDSLLDAKVVAIEPRVSTSNRNILARAILKTGSLIPGTFVKVVISNVTQAITVPSNAIIPDAMSNQVVLLKDGKAEFTDVRTGSRNADNVQIIEGLKNGDSVLIGGVLNVRPHSKVKVKKVKQAALVN